VGKIWLIGGTSESATLAQALALATIPCLITVTSETARGLYPTASTLQVWVAKFAQAELHKFCQEQRIVAIVDASHPFAVQISELAIGTSRELGIPYLRFERSALAPANNPTQEFATIPELLASNTLDNQRVLLTLGYRMLPLFTPWQTRSTLFSRILPSTIALETALAAGFTPERLIALRPPISLELERALWQQWQISLVVTKASGSPGGENTKRQLAQELGVGLITIARPDMNYLRQTSVPAEVVEFCQSVLLSNKSALMTQELSTLDP
jgi:precorrin-6A/cobalt-precorrin-6A reductase